MPNHCNNTLGITGPTKDIEDFIELVTNKGPDKDENEYELFNNLLPMPKELVGTTSPSKEGNVDLIDKYGHDNWYDWCIFHWGTKWNAYDVTEWSINEDGDNSSATIYYETAWSPVTALWMWVSNDYPTLDFYHEYADEGGAFLGSETIREGRIISTEEYEWDSDDGIELREQLGRYWPEDDEVEA